MKGKTLTILGSINADHVISVPYFAKPGETLTGQNYQISYGGKGANQAVAAARLGAKVVYWLAVQMHIWGRWLFVKVRRKLHNRIAY